MNPKSVKYNQYERYSRIGDSWIESEYSHMKFSFKEWDSIYRQFRGLTNKNVHMLVNDLTCEYSGLPSPKFYDNY